MPNPYVKRRAEAMVEEALLDTRVVTVNGARQAGKSTLVRQVLRHYPRSLERRLDRASERLGATTDPERFVRHDGLLAIDEVQRVPELILAIKAVVDDDPQPGRFLLTGSARLLGLRKLPDALIGRMETVELWPFSQGEIDGTSEHFIDTVFELEPSFPGAGCESRDGYLERALRGGFPEAVRREPRRRRRFFENYLDDLIDRDVVQLAEIERRDQLRSLVRLLATRMAQPLSIDRLANEASIPARTLARYLALFEEVFLIKRLDGWSASNTPRATRMRKLLFVDTGLAGDQLALSPRRLERDQDAAGRLLENFVLSELNRQLTWSETRARLGHYRTKDGTEVDGILEGRDGRIVGIEVKASSTARPEDFRGLRHLQARLGTRFHCGVLLYTGTSTVPFGERFTAVPIDALWCDAPADRESHDRGQTGGIKTAG